MDIGKRIILLREKKGWSQRELASRVGLNPSVMNRIESENRPIKDEELLKLSNVLECTSDHLLGRSNFQNSALVDKNEEDFQAFANSPDLQKWYKELPKSKEEDLRLLREMWETIKRNK
ncbi:helix-turn-helix transcriptional regulator [Viridibacillus sp. YIM B01967]|uniref:Helix-turn-helix transcriptional regulator n=1 Tax=Viridibacillus soli TaxID=2798301 RepID=A0ABS1H793_9BACL|nr:helix-turn-helix transcriptional regulator [Viridibacillus soli]MBK3495290.1 helix-turn-helix transcriptional regulator [Viridibacillus soli]